jgi:GNAT superfamily N-acetyltransferase
VDLVHFAATAITGEEVQGRLSEGPVWLATIQAEFLGTVSAIRRPHEVYVRGMAVIPSARGHAVGWRLLEEVDKFAIASGCGRLSLSTTPFLTRAIHLYER